MAWQAANDITIPWRTMGATALQASVTITTTTQSTPVFCGRGVFEVAIDVTALTLGTGFDVVVFYVERDSIASTTTWQQIGMLAVGDATGVGLSTQGVDSYYFAVHNSSDNRIRINAYVLGSAASVTYSADIYPLRSRITV